MGLDLGKVLGGVASHAKVEDYAFAGGVLQEEGERGDGVPDGFVVLVGAEEVFWEGEGAGMEGGDTNNDTATAVLHESCFHRWYVRHL
jgi:hypothetical protein